MKRALIAALATAAAGLTVAASPAVAREGCGQGWHRAPNGRCVRNGPPRVVVARPAPVLVVGRYYEGRGYWNGGRYWRERYRWHNGWRYR